MLYLFVTALDGSTTAKRKFSSDEASPGIGLHCDSRWQLFYVKSFENVAVTDLAGQVRNVIQLNELSQICGKFPGIDGNNDKVVHPCR